MGLCPYLLLISNTLENVCVNSKKRVARQETNFFICRLLCKRKQ